MNKNTTATLKLDKKADLDVLQYLSGNSMSTQRELAEELGYSLGAVNQSLNNLKQLGYITEDGELTLQVEDIMSEFKPKKAIILAAGAGMRMVPVNRTFSKAMLEVHGEILIERLINQLHEAGIKDIYVVVGFMKEQFEYLMDKYDIKLLVNSEYDTKNNLASLYKARKYLKNAYIVPCDLWCEKNPFNKYELYPWYMVKKEISNKSDIALNRKGELVKVQPEEIGNAMIGIAYLDDVAAEFVVDKLDDYSKNSLYDNSFWEETLYDKQKMVVLGKTDRWNIKEINTYEHLREIDSKSSQLDSDAVRLLAEIFDVNKNEITDIKVLKAGMTNRSFEFKCKGKRYIMRIPGEGTDQMINRKQEYQVYQAIKDLKICDDIIYMNPDNGYKVTGFIEDARNCDCENMQEVAVCMKYLRNFHEQKLKVDHEFDIFKQIDFYEGLWNGAPSAYVDYAETKKNVLSLKKYIDSQEIEKVLTHIDANHDNFLFSKDGVRLIGWEYAGMQDPHVDIAMFAIYAMYDREQVEELIDSYFYDGCELAIRKKIYCYIAMSGLLWSNWCEYKKQFGIEFGEYNLRQYRYAKDYYRLFKQLDDSRED